MVDCFFVLGRLDAGLPRTIILIPNECNIRVSYMKL